MSMPRWLLPLVLVPDHHQSFSYVFTERFNNSGFGGGTTSSFGFCQLPGTVFSIFILAFRPFSSSVANWLSKVGFCTSAQPNGGG